MSDELLIKLNTAVKAANEAETIVTTAQGELVSRSKAVGLLLLEAKKLHPRVTEFEAYLQQVDGLKLSRAYDLLRLAGGRTTDDELKKEARERKQKSRAAKKTLPPPPKSLSKSSRKDSVTVTESATAMSARNLKEFEYACQTYLPRLNSGDLKKANNYFNRSWSKQVRSFTR